MSKRSPIRERDRKKQYTSPVAAGPGLSVLAAVIIVGTMLQLGGCSTPTDPMAKRLVVDGATLVDVRTPAEYSRGHVAGAINIPVQHLSRRLAQLGDKKTPIVVYCRSGSRSSYARSLLLKNGFSTVHDMGRMTAWPK